MMSDYSAAEETLPHAGERGGLRRMKLVAGGLLFSMLPLYLAARHYEGQLPELIWLKVFAEAALIGGLADWFAVTALFRHPLGLPIPHTAIIPASKQRIGVGLGRFIQNNFLSEEAVEHRLNELNLSQAISRWLEREENSRKVSSYLIGILPGIIDALDDEDLRQFLALNLRTLISRTEAAPFAGKVLELLCSEQKFDELLEGLLTLGSVLLSDHQEEVSGALFNEAPWYVPLFVHKKVFQGFVDNLKSTIKDVEADPHHPLRATIKRVIEDLIKRLRTSSDLLRRGEELKERLLRSELPANYAALVWTDVKQQVLGDLRSDTPALRQSLQSAVSAFGKNLVNDDKLRQKINLAAIHLSRRAVANYSGEVSGFIAGTIDSWDESTVSERIELYVGRDLQFIRINGTLVGGAVGMLLHLFSQIAENL